MARTQEEVRDLQNKSYCVILIMFVIMLHVCFYASVLPSLSLQNRTRIRLENQSDYFFDNFDALNLSDNIKQRIIKNNIIADLNKHLDDAKQEIIKYSKNPIPNVDYSDCM